MRYDTVCNLKPIDVARFVDMDGNGQNGKFDDNMTLVKQFIPFGAMEEIYTCRHILQNDVVERLGKLVNWAYCNDCSFDGYPKDFNECDLKWEDCCCFDRQSSLSSARGLIRAWKEYKYDIVLNRFGDRSLVFQLEPFKQNENEDALAKREHLRWMAFHFSRGIRPWKLYLADSTAGLKELRDDLGLIDKRNNEKVKAKQIPEFNAHAALVSFDELPRVDFMLDVMAGEKSYSEDDGKYDCYKGKDGRARGDKSLQANDYAINNLLHNLDALKAVGLVLMKVPRVGNQNESEVKQ